MTGTLRVLASGCPVYMPSGCGVCLGVPALKEAALIADLHSILLQEGLPGFLFCTPRIHRIGSIVATCSSTELGLPEQGTYQLNIPRVVENTRGVNYNNVDQVGFEQA